jgi:hypothetical protein
LLAAVSGAYAQNSSSGKQQYAEASRQAAARYADDKKLCAEETSSSARMQCLRDAKAVYNGALDSAKKPARTTTLTVTGRTIIEISRYVLTAVASLR